MKALDNSKIDNNWKYVPKYGIRWDVQGIIKKQPKICCTKLRRIKYESI